MAELSESVDEPLASLGALAYRQCLAAHKLVANCDGSLLMFSTENFSNGCMGTVDVIYPAAPFFLHFNPALLEAQIRPVLEYAASPRWRHRFAPHDLGTYPLANGQAYGEGEAGEKDQMPVEESGNMLLMVAALTRRTGDFALAQEFWPLLERWAAFLVEEGRDPKPQLCTDDFTGYLGHNVNLAIKAALAVGAFGLLCEAMGYPECGADARAEAGRMAARCVEEAHDGDHFRLAFDQPGSWSQKYNLVWDAMLGLELFPHSFAEAEIAHYLKNQNRFGLPLDCRNDYTKLDWIAWTAALAHRREDRDALLAPLAEWAHHTESRVPLTDWFDSVTGKQCNFQARSVVGGLFIVLLDPFG
jgi:hypothetical protein